MLSLKNLPLKNLKGYPGRTAALLIFATLMAVSVFGGTMLIEGVRQGLETVESRLGADIMVTPESADNDFDAQTVLLQAEPGYFYMDASVLDGVLKIDGVELASPQLFLTSAKAGCCSVRVQMIAFDPETDFTIQPWIKDTGISQEPGLMEVVIGSNVSWTSVAEENVIRFYDNECRVVGQFEPTGSSLDSAVYMNFDTCKALIRSCREKGMFKYENLDADSVISSVMVRVKPGFDIEETAADIREHIEGVSVTTSKNMVAGIGESLNRIEKSVSVFAAVFWVIGMFMTVLIFAMMINERKREFASLTAMGADRKIISGIVTGEAFFINLCGGLLGIGLSAVVLIMFRGLISQSLGVGFVLPRPGKVILPAGAALLSVILAAGISSWAAIRKISRADAGLVLKEGE